MKKLTIAEYDKKSEIWTVDFDDNGVTYRRRYASFNTLMAVIKDFWKLK